MNSDFVFRRALHVSRENHGLLVFFGPERFMFRCKGGGLFRRCLFVRVLVCFLGWYLLTSDPLSARYIALCVSSYQTFSAGVG